LKTFFINFNNMKHKLKIDKPKVDNMVFRTKGSTEELTFDDWFDEFIGNTDIIQKLKNKKREI